MKEKFIWVIYSNYDGQHCEQFAIDPEGTLAAEKCYTDAFNKFKLDDNGASQPLVIKGEIVNVKMTEVAVKVAFEY